jgi:hypothetical protein
MRFEPQVRFFSFQVFSYFLSDFFFTDTACHHQPLHGPKYFFLTNIFFTVADCVRNNGGSQLPNVKI